VDGVRRLPLLIAFATLLATLAAVSAPVAHAATAQWVIDENAKPGTRAWRIPASAPHDIQGYANKISVDEHGRVTLYVDTTAATFHVAAFRLGSYGGLGGRRIWTSREIAGIRQPAPTVDPDTYMVEAPWAPSFSFHVGDRWVQGSYLLKLVASTGGQSYIPFVVRDDASTAALLVQHQVFTWQAYNAWGGRSLYHGPTGFASRSRVVSFDRPYDGDGAGGMLRALPMLALMEGDGMDVTYGTDRDTHLRPSLLTQHRALVTLNHDEYWSSAMRDGVEAARAAGVNFISLGANAIYRHVRVEDSPLGKARRVVCYKIASEDPLLGIDDKEVTTNWRSTPVPRPESALLGAMYHCHGVKHADMVVPDADVWVFAGAGLTDGAHIPGAVDGEIDRVFPNAPTPASIQVLAHSPVTCGGASSVSDMTYYTASSGAGVVDVGSLGWFEMLRCGPPVSGRYCSAAGVAITRNLLRESAAGPLGLAHPARANAGTFGYSLTHPTHP
jgi:N,N-dimethylformamidase beta subunit-like protein